MARVLIFANDNSTIFNFRRELLHRLVSDGHQVTVALPANERNQAFRDLGCEVLDIQLSRFGTNPIQECATLWAFVKTIRRTSPDVVLTYTAKPNVYGGLAAQFSRVPYISTVTGLGAAFQSEGLLRRVSSLLQRLAYRGATRVFFQNSENLRSFRRLGIVSDQATVLPGSGVNLDLHRLEPYAPDDGVIRFVTVSRIRRDKGFDELFAAIRRACASRQDLEFHIVGWYEDDAYQAAVAELESGCPVVAHGSVSQEQVHRIVSQSHVLIHPSHHEGMANVILEASAAGVPSIATDIAGCREAIEDGSTGILVPAQDVDALELAIHRMADMDWEIRRKMGLAARQKMTTEFDREAVVDHYMAEIRDICAPSAQEERV